MKIFFRFFLPVNTAGVAFATVHVLASAGFVAVVLSGADRGFFSWLVVAMDLPVSFLYEIAWAASKELLGKMAADIVFYSACVIVGSIWYGCVGQIFGKV